MFHDVFAEHQQLLNSATENQGDTPALSMRTIAVDGKSLRNLLDQPIL